MSLCDAMCVFCFDVFFFKQKTAYEMRISDWSSDVCSSDLSRERAAAGAPHQASRRPRTAAGRPFLPPSRASSGRAAAPPRPSPIAAFRGATASCEGRSEEHTSELQSLMRISYAVFCLKKKTKLHEFSQQQAANNQCATRSELTTNNYQ